MQRVLVLLIASSLAIGAACTRSADRGPQWPEMAEREEDGGEPIDPKPGVIAEASKKDDKKDAKKDDKKGDEDDDAKPAAAATTTTTDAAKSDDAPDATLSTPTITAPEEVINLDDIVIEIDDED